MACLFPCKLLHICNIRLRYSIFIVGNFIYTVLAMGQKLRFPLISCIFFCFYAVQFNALQQGSVFDIRRIGRAFCSSAVSIGIIVGGINICESNADTAPAKVAPALFGLKKERLLPCKAASNCISSSSFQSLEHYGKPWSFSESNSADEEFTQIVNALKSTEFRLKIVDQNDQKRYIRAEARSAIPITGTDDLEFLVNPIDKIITYRTNSREVAMAGPQVITDGGSNKNRLDIIRRKLGVFEMGESEESIKFMAKEQSMGFITKMRRDSTPNEINFIDNSVPAQTEDLSTPTQSAELK